MAAAYIFDSEGLKTLARYIEPDTLFAFNLDDTLALVNNECNYSRICDQLRATLERLNQLSKVAFFTGSSRSDALVTLGFEPYLLVGVDGAGWSNYNDKRNWNQVKRCLKWQERLYDSLGHQSVIEIVYKGESISMCYRNAENSEDALSQINAAIEKLDPLPQKFCGTSVVSLLPQDALTKGKVIAAAKEMLGVKQAAFISDDETDGDIFKMQDIDILSIYVGQNEQTEAQYYLRKKTALLGLLNSMVGILEVHGTAACDSGNE